jgi:hypothetical protein
MKDWNTKASALSPRCPQRTRWDAERYQRGAIGQVRYPAGRIGVSRQIRRWCEFSVTPKADEMLLPGDNFAVGVQSAFEEMPAGRPVEIVLHVVGAIPKKFHRHAGDFRDPGRLGHVIGHQAPAEAAANPGHVNDDVLFIKTERFCDQRATRLWILCRRPNLHLAILHAGGAIHRLKRRVSDKRI